MDSSSLSWVSGAAACLSAASITLIVRLVYFALYIWVVTNWKTLAAAAEPPVPEDLLPDVISALEKLEAAFRPLEQSLPPDTLLWTDSEDVA